MTADSPALRAAVHAAVSAALAPEGIAPLRAYEDPPFPMPGPEENVCCYFLQPSAAPAPPDQTLLTAGETGVLRRRLRQWPYTLVLIFYGPDAEKAALNARTRLMTGAPLKTLHAAGLWPEPPPMPALLREEDGGHFRKRADLRVPLTAADGSFTETLPRVTAVPEVTLHV